MKRKAQIREVVRIMKEESKREEERENAKMGVEEWLPGMIRRPERMEWRVNKIVGVGEEGAIEKIPTTRIL